MEEKSNTSSVTREHLEAVPDLKKKIKNDMSSSATTQVNPFSQQELSLNDLLE